MACRRLRGHRRRSDGLDAGAESRDRRRRNPPAWLSRAHAGRKRRTHRGLTEMGTVAWARQRVRGHIARGAERAVAAHQVGLYRRRESAEWGWEDRLQVGTYLGSSLTSNEISLCFQPVATGAP